MIAIFSISRMIPEVPSIPCSWSSTAENREASKKEPGPDKPIYLQFITYMEDVLQRDLGDSPLTKRSAEEEPLRRLPSRLNSGFTLSSAGS
ncbi:hypothetical protein [Candidatus Amarobacter glycogenicus]|uniref:hypothetical protein n=1 Tax=Candidatus Amarobacter glycogenicus TaxID=3140699 RepID=UPI002A13286F|nr:hypothetical protein [Dehalococcoidia bacterium]